MNISTLKSLLRQARKHVECNSAGCSTEHSCLYPKRCPKNLAKKIDDAVKRRTGDEVLPK